MRTPFFAALLSASIVWTPLSIEAAWPALARTASTSRSHVQFNGMRVDAGLTRTDPSGCLLHATEPGLVAPNADTVKVINNDA